MERPEHGAQRKVPYSRWLYGRALIGRLRPKMSWTEISRAVKGHGNSPGWAAEAFQYPNMMSDRDVTGLERLCFPKPANGAGNQLEDRRLAPDQQRAYKALLLKLVERHGWSRRQIAVALGYTTNDGVSAALHAGGGMLSKLTRAQEIVNGIEQEARAAGAAQVLAGGGAAPLPLPPAPTTALEAERAPGEGEKAPEEPGAGRRRPEERLRASLEEAAGALVEMGEGAPPFQKGGIDEAIGKLGDLMKFLGL